MDLPENKAHQFAIEKLAEGLSDEEVADNAFDAGFNLTVAQVSTLSRRYSRAIAFIASEKAEELLKSVPRANKFIRISKLDNLGEKLEQILNIISNQQLSLITSGTAMDPREINAYTKLMTTYLTLSRLIGEETKNITPPEKQLNAYIQITNNIPREERERLQASVRAQIEEVRNAAQKALSQPEEEAVIDAEFESGEESEPNT